jgi:hypothetical protein
VAHTFPHLALDALNKKNVTAAEAAAKDCWVMMIKIGPFERWEDCVSFLNLWITKTRGKTRRLERGVELFNAYRDRYNLNMWAQTKTKQQVIEEYNTSTPLMTTTLFKKLEEEENKEDETVYTVSKSTIEDMLLTNKTTVHAFKKVHDAMERSKKRIKV